MEIKHAHLSLVPRSRFPALHPNGYQKTKARRIAASLIRACDGSSVTVHELPGIVARMSMAQWQTMAFQAGVAVADYTAKLLTIERLKKAARG